MTRSKALAAFPEAGQAAQKTLIQGIRCGLQVCTRTRTHTHTLSFKWLLEVGL